jgi:hypothetical protein
MLGILFLGGIESRGQGPAALSGVVSSQEEGKMEGVIVSAKKNGSTITVSVVSDNQGRYTFPGNRLQPGNYSIKTRATGYDLVDPGAVKLEAGKTAQVDLKLQTTKDIAKQMEPADWFLSNPKIKDQLIDGVKFGQNCVGCHSLYPIMTSKYPANAWSSIFSRMFQYSSASIFEPGEVRVPINHPYDTVRLKPDGTCCLDDTELAQFIASVNLSSRPDGKWPFELKRMPRPSGRGTRVIITEFDVPRRQSQPHDLAVDSDGMVWYNDHGNQYIGRLNPRTGEVKEWLVPGVTADKAAGRSSGRPRFDLSQENISGPLWFGRVTVNRETEEFTLGKGYLRADGNIWNEVDPAGRRRSPDQGSRPDESKDGRGQALRRPGPAHAGLRG